MLSDMNSMTLVQGQKHTVAILVGQGILELTIN